MTMLQLPQYDAVISEPGYYPSEAGLLVDFGHVLVFCRGINKAQFTVEASSDGGETWGEHPFFPTLPDNILVARHRGHQRTYVVASPLRLRLNVASVDKELIAKIKSKL